MRAGISGRAKELRTTYASEADGLPAGRAEWIRVQRGIFDFLITLAYGRRDAMPQSPKRVAGIKDRIDEPPWIVLRVRHTVEASGGYTSQLTLETELTDGAGAQRMRWSGSRQQRD